MALGRTNQVLAIMILTFWWKEAGNIPGHKFIRALRSGNDKLPKGNNTGCCEPQKLQMGSPKITEENQDTLRLMLMESIEYNVLPILFYVMKLKMHINKTLRCSE